MSVIAVGSVRFAVGIEWEGELVKGRDASQLGWENGRPWTVDVGEQTGFVDGEGSPGGAPALAGVLRKLWNGAPGQEESWIAAIGEDRGEDRQSEPRVVVVRCNRGVLLADGEEVFASGAEAFEDLARRSESVPMMVTPGLAARAPEAEVVSVEVIVEAAAGVGVVVELPALGRRGQVVRLVAVLVGIVGLGGAGAIYGPGLVDLAWQEWFTEKKPKAEPLPTVDVAVATPSFLNHCREEMARREVRMAGFDRVGVFCRSSFTAGDTGASWDLEGRAVLEVRWQLREPLSARVYGPLAEDLLRRWHWAGVRDEGVAVAVSPLPLALVRATGIVEVSPVAFRARIDRTLAMQGFDIEYAGWGAVVEVVLTTDGPFPEAIAMVGAVEGLEVLQATFTENLWRFEARRTRPRNLLEREFDALAAPLKERVAAAVGNRRVESDG